MNSKNSISLFLHGKLLLFDRNHKKILHNIIIIMATFLNSNEILFGNNSIEGKTLPNKGDIPSRN